MENKFLALLLVSIALITISCKDSAYKLNTIASEDIYDEKVLINEIENKLNILDKGIELLNADTIFGLFSKNNGASYIRDGHIYEKIRDANKQYSRWFSNPNYGKQQIVFDTKRYTIINKNLVLLTTIGTIVQSKNNKDTAKNEPWKIAYSILWIKEKNNWAILNMHTSWK